MGRVKYIARRKKKTTNSPPNQPATRARDPSTNRQPINFALPDIQPKARPHDGPRAKDEVEWYLAPPSVISARTEYFHTTNLVADNLAADNLAFTRRVVPSKDAFNIYTNIDVEAPVSRKRGSRRHPGESNSDPSKKKARTVDPPTPTPSKDTTPPPAPRNPTPLAPRNTTHPEQSRKTQGVLTMSTSWRHSKETDAKHVEEIKSCEERAKLCEEKAKAYEEHVACLSEELRRSQEAVVRITASKNQFKEASEINFKEASKHQDELVACWQKVTELEGRVKLLEETNARNLEKFKGVTFNCFYLFRKNNPEENFDYLPEHARKLELTRCAARLEEEKARESPEISSATGIEGVEEETRITVDQQSQPDPLAALAA
ncbi:actin cytoskeleton-regulatory complex protein PAN1-like [Humulus lupulus]|uniref:actin cytoskeleton-regulatory complex protein PAN1-like n=1 Tax=Humulus lupulus TaxID=3486 RepID=UPI002B401C7E|nr:actin cytoskeleton-regulatory complex protein PAN1-like [Humulus lupulus]